MRPLAGALLAAVVVAATSACDPLGPRAIEAPADDRETFDLAAAVSAIAEQGQRFTEAHVTGDTAFLNAIFTDDARVYPPGAEVVTGRDAIARLNAEYVAFGITEFREEAKAIYGGREYLIEEGVYVMVYGPDPTSERGSYLNVWTQVDGAWRLDANIWNTTEATGPDG